tara:strand:+ start:183 stop:551 length:369 start_codon:yes stop_codon:yes gene_type:complete
MGNNSPMLLFVFLLIIILCVRSKEKQIESKSKSKCGSDTIIPQKSSNIVMYGRESCPYTVKMINELKQSRKWKDITYVDVSQPSGKEEFDRLNLTAVPAFSGNGRIALGYMPTSKLYKTLDM